MSEISNIHEFLPDQGIGEALVRAVPIMDELRARKNNYSDLKIDTYHPKFNEPLVDIADYGLAGQAYYSRPNASTFDPVPEVPTNLYLRKSVAEALVTLNIGLRNPVFTEFFGGDVELYVEDALRPVTLQRRLYDIFMPELIRRNHPGISSEQVEKQLKDLIAVPSSDPLKPSPHATGGVFDVVLRYRQSSLGYVEGTQVPMGHVDADTGSRIFPDFFELNEPKTPDDKIAQKNRRAYYAIMTGMAFGVDTGFVCNPTEWWHWGIGDQLSEKVRGNGPAYYSFIEPVSE